MPIHSVGMEGRRNPPPLAWMGGGIQSVVVLRVLLLLLRVPVVANTRAVNMCSMVVERTTDVSGVGGLGSTVHLDARHLLAAMTHMAVPDVLHQQWQTAVMSCYISGVERSITSGRQRGIWGVWRDWGASVRLASDGCRLSYAP